MMTIFSSHRIFRPSQNDRHAKKKWVYVKNLYKNLVDKDNKWYTIDSPIICTWSISILVNIFMLHG